MKYLIAGTGGVGGSIAGFLSLAGKDVTCIARGAHLQAIQTNGLKLKSDLKGEHTLAIPATTAEEFNGKADVIFVCVKGYSVDSITELIKRAAHDKTIVIPILNVYGTGPRIQRLVPGVTVLDGCIYIVGFVSGTGEITQMVHKWTIHDYMVRELDGLKEKITKGDKIDSIINMEPSDFLIMKNQQEMLTSPQLSDYIEKQKRRGFANIKEFEIEYHKRIAMSFASFILTIIGVSLSSRKTKGGMGLHLGIGLGLSFSYILFQTITSTFAINGNVPPAIAVWIPNILYAGIAFYLYQKAPK